MMNEKKNKKDKDTREKKYFKQVRTNINLRDYFTTFGKYDKEELVNSLSEFVLQKDINTNTKKAKLRRLALIVQLFNKACTIHFFWDSKS